MLVAHLLHRDGIGSVVLEEHSRPDVLSRIRASVLEPGMAQLPRPYGLGERMDREGHAHDGVKIVWAGREGFFIKPRRRALHGLRANESPEGPVPRRGGT
jgi:p-hydroxybenzoate 3-monooxygenase